MPNQNSDNQNQTTQDNNFVPFSAQTDLPPLPPDFQKVDDGQEPTHQDAGVDPKNGSASPPVPNITQITPSSPKKKFGGGKIIATILGIFILVGGVGAGILLTQQQQLFQQKARSFDCGYDANGNKNDNFCTSSCAAGHNQAGNCVKDGEFCCNLAATTPAPSTNPNKGSCIFDHYQHTGVCTQVGGQWMKCDTDPIGEEGYSSSVCQNYPPAPGLTYDYGCDPDYPNCVTGGYCINTSKKCTPSVPAQANCTPDSSCGSSTTKPTTTPTKSPTPSPTPAKDCYSCNSNNQCVFDEGCKMSGPRCSLGSVCSPTPTPFAPYCAAIHAYDTSWNSLNGDTSNKLSSLKPGDKVRFTVNGEPSGSITKAKFTITAKVGGLSQTTNSGDVTARKPGTNEFYYEYTIPSGATSISVKGQIYATSSWF